MKRLILSFAFLSLTILSANAQKTSAVNKISLGADFLYPTTGLLKDSYNLGYGGSMEGEYNVWKKLNITASVGVISMVYQQDIKDFQPDIKNDQYYPINLGGKYYFKNFYATLTSGAAISFTDNRNPAFIYAGGFGKAFAVSAKSNIDFGVKFQGWTSYINSLNAKPSTSTFVGLRAAYSFGL